MDIDLLPGGRDEDILDLLMVLDPRQDRAVVRARLAEMRQRGYLCAGASDGGRLLGISGIWILSKYYVGRHVEMDDVVVHPDARGRGIGHRLVAWVEGFAVRLGARAIELNCYAGNERGNAFWLATGFRQLGNHYQKLLPEAPPQEAARTPCDASIRTATSADAPAISDIYNHYVRHSTCTYQEEPETPDDRRRWLATHTGGYVVRVAVEDGAVVGWASLSPFHQRSAYRFTAENSIYLRPDRLGRGLGTRLLEDLLDQARTHGFRTIIAGVDAEQPASIALHRRAGFAQVSHLRSVGFKFGRWLDVIQMQRLLA